MKYLISLFILLFSLGAISQSHHFRNDSLERGLMIVVNDPLSGLKEDLIYEGIQYGLSQEQLEKLAAMRISVKKDCDGQKGLCFQSEKLAERMNGEASSRLLKSIILSEALDLDEKSLHSSIQANEKDLLLELVYEFEISGESYEN